MIKHRPGTLLRWILFGLAFFLCYWVYGHQFSTAANWFFIVGGMLLVFPIVWTARKALDRWPSTELAEWTNIGVHFALLNILGMAIIKAVQTHQAWIGWRIPIPQQIGYGLSLVTGIAGMLTVVNLAVKGIGAPFAIALTKKLAIDGMYAWTRNPMVLATLLMLASLGLWFQSALFVVWAVGLVSPAWLAFVKIYEEKELEIRFGAPYLEYKARTPLLFPRKPSV